MAVDPRLIPALVREPGSEDTEDLHDTREALMAAARDDCGPLIAALPCAGTAFDRLARTVAARKDADPETSWTARLFAKGPEKCAEKFGEEAVEAIIEAVKGDRERLTAEAADVLYHLLVMLAARDVSLDAVMAELERRSGTSGIAEKAARDEG